LHLGQTVVGLDNFSTGFESNLKSIRERAGAGHASRFTFVHGDIRNFDLLGATMRDHRVQVVLHQAALGSVSRSIEDPLASHDSNLNGTLNVFWAAHRAGVKRVVYASSSSVYGDHPGLPKREAETGNLLSPYAATKWFSEQYASLFARVYGLEPIGLRYFNVFGERQNPHGAYAAVIPKWIDLLSRAQDLKVYGDGETSRDFCFVDNAVQANLRAALLPSGFPGIGQAFNVAAGERTTLNQLADTLQELVGKKVKLRHKDFRAGDIRHSLADLSRSQEVLGYRPEWTLRRGLERAVPWYLRQETLNDDRV
jgi:UDP-N-acetylglucosamine 4-epimerase